MVPRAMLNMSMNVFSKPKAQQFLYLDSRMLWRPIPCQLNYFASAASGRPIPTEANLFAIIPPQLPAFAHLQCTENMHE